MDDPHVDRLRRLFDEYGLAAGPVRKTVLIVTDDSSTGLELDAAKRYFADNGPAVEFAFVADVDKIAETAKRTYNAVLSGVLGDRHVPCDLHLFSAYAGLLACGGALIVKTENPGVTEAKTSKQLRTHGFVDVAVSATPGIIVGYTPSYEVGTSNRVTLNSKAKENVVAAWKLDDDDDPETISEDDLLEADDLKKPVQSTLRVCATTKKAKACKNCSCGLAEELEANRVEDVPKPVPDTSNAKSSCGSCYLGDAFRCASCPYLGMPAFKPGEKVQLAGNLLQDDF